MEGRATGDLWVALCAHVLMAMACSSPESGKTGIQDGTGGADASTVDGSTSGGQGGGAGTGGNPSSGGGATGGASTGGATSSGGAASIADTYARASAVVGSCILDDGVERNDSYLWYSASISRVWGRFGTQAECLATHGGGCAAVRDCTGWNWDTAPDVCATGCDGTTYTTCAGGRRFQVDCAKLGLVCDPVAICADALTTACDSSTFVPSCHSSGIPVFCDDGAVLHGPDCASLGLACVAGVCAGTGAACTGGDATNAGEVFYDPIACDGDTLLTCVAGHEHRLSCPEVSPGFSCQTHDGASFCGIANECTPSVPGSGSGSRGTCAGTALVFCNAGRLEHVDCTSLGFERCDTTNAYGCVPNFFTP